MVEQGVDPVQEEDQTAKIAWRIVGASESPLKSPELTNLISGVVDKHVPANVRIRTIETINRWYETRDGRWSLAADTKEEVDELVLRGAAQQLLEAIPAPRHDTLFWAIGAVDPEAAVEAIRASWCPKQIDALLEYTTGVLQELCENHDVIDPSETLGFKVERGKGKAYVDPDYKQERIKALHLAERFQPNLYHGVAKVIQLIMTIRPDWFPKLVEQADHPAVQRWALFFVSRCLRTDRSRALDWLKGKPSEPLIAIAIVQGLGTIRELGWEAEQKSRDQRDREEAYGAASRLLSGLVNQLAQYEPAESVRWIAELYKERRFLLGMNRGTGIYDLGDDLEEHCIEKLAELVRQRWDSDMHEALKSNAPRGSIAQENLPLGTVASKVYADYPDRAAEIAKIVLEKHANHIDELMANNVRAHYTLTESRSIKWMRGLGAALAIALPEGESPSDWVITQCSQLPLSAWDADDLPEKFRLAGDVVQIQLTVAMYALVARYEAGLEVKPETARNLAEKAWEYCHFLSQQETSLLEDPEVDELAARVAIALGDPDEEWLITQAKGSKISPRGLWSLVDAYIEKDGYPKLANELGSSIAARYRYTKGAKISTLRYLARIWQLLEAGEAALETAETMIEYHRTAMEREDYVVMISLLILAACKKGATSRMKREIRYLHDYLWRNHTPNEEAEVRRSADALLA